MNKKIIPILTIMLIFLLGAGLRAQGYTVGKNENVYILRGEANPYQSLTLAVFGPESGSLDIGDAIYLSQIRCDRQGEFLFEIALENNALPGIYTFVVANMQNPRLIEGSFFNGSESLSDKEKVQWDIQALSLQFDDESERIELPQAVGFEIGYGSSITWSSTHPAVTIDGEYAYVNRGKITQQEIILTATASYNNSRAVRDFVLNIAPLTDEQRVARDLDSLIIDEENPSFPSTGEYGCSLEWSVINTDSVHIENGALLVQYHELTGDITVEVKCVVRFNNKNAEKTFSLVVKALTPEERIRADLDDIVVNYNGTDDTITLPDKGALYHTPLLWNSSNPKVIEPFRTMATVNRNGLTADTVVTLTAISNNEYSLQKSFTVTVKKSAQTSGSTSGGGGSRQNMAYTTPAVETGQKEDEPKASGYKDLKGFEWAKGAVQFLTEKGIITGIGEGMFAPDKKVTRAEFVTMLVRAFYKDAIAENVNFPDVSKEDWYYNPVAVAQKMHIIEGDETGLFYPEADISREDMFVIITRIISLPPANVQMTFEDTDQLSDYAAEASIRLYAAGLIKGDGTLLNPKSHANRAEAAQMIFNILAYMSEL